MGLATWGYFEVYLLDLQATLRIQGVPRHKFVLATKVGRYGADTFDFSAPRVAKIFSAGVKYSNM